ncbi:TPA: hypothetical protein N0F65_004795 [Lagenidium giganteum]|uniref:Uncharacterized protein n=1 Tax=Lagenidium giganteum TaxID=4803 RepID=A0AAV2Z8E2_9STRA|nr:TPA: hypothetical protein N0F65_004795 [Lagenidium giganteum]
MPSSWKLAKKELFGDFQLGEEAIHVLVELPTRQETSVEATSPLYTRKRWKPINELIQLHKKSKPNKQGEMFIPYSDMKWNDLEPLYRPFLKPFVLQPKPIPIDPAQVDALYSCLERFTGVFGGVFSGTETKRLFFIAPVLAYVSHLLPDVRLLVEENVNGSQVQASGRFEFVIRRGEKRVGIVEAKKDDMDQGMAQNLLGCEVLADVEQLPATVIVPTAIVPTAWAQSCQLLLTAVSQ